MLFFLYEVLSYIYAFPLQFWEDKYFSLIFHHLRIMYKQFYFQSLKYEIGKKYSDVIYFVLIS